MKKFIGFLVACAIISVTFSACKSHKSCPAYGQAKSASKAA